MARQLTKEAKSKLLDDASLYADICLLIGVKPNSLTQLIYRNSSWLTNHDVVLKIAEAMHKQTEEILEEAEESTVVMP